jgi:hypothetical protein
MSFQKILAIVGAVTLVVLFRVQIVQIVNMLGNVGQQVGR